MGKEVKKAMEVIDTDNNDVKKAMSYEELNNVAHQLSEQSRTLYEKLQEANMTNAFKRLDYLFKVLEMSNFFAQEFYSKCAGEIEAIITLPEQAEVTQDNA